MRRLMRVPQCINTVSVNVHHVHHAHVHHASEGGQKSYYEWDLKPRSHYTKTLDGLLWIKSRR